jgi:hypothetical protein
LGVMVRVTVGTRMCETRPNRKRLGQSSNQLPELAVSGLSGLVSLPRPLDVGDMRKRVTNQASDSLPRRSLALVARAETFCSPLGWGFLVQQAFETHHTTDLGTEPITWCMRPCLG